MRLTRNQRYYRKHRDQERARSRAYNIENKDKRIVYEKKRYAADPEFYKEKSRSYSERNRPKVNAYVKKKYATDINFRLRSALRVRLYRLARNRPRAGSSVRDLGCTLKEFRAHLESIFLPGMSWDNWSYKGWHIDHVLPLSHFDLSKRAEILKAVNYKNMQPMWRADNQKKGNRV